MYIYFLNSLKSQTMFMDDQTTKIDKRVYTGSIFLLQNDL